MDRAAPAAQQLGRLYGAASAALEQTDPAFTAICQHPFCIRHLFFNYFLNRGCFFQSDRLY